MLGNAAWNVAIRAENWSLNCCSCEIITHLPDTFYRCLRNRLVCEEPCHYSDNLCRSSLLKGRPAPLGETGYLAVCRIGSWFLNTIGATGAGSIPRYASNTRRMMSAALVPCFLACLANSTRSWVVKAIFVRTSCDAMGVAPCVGNQPYPYRRESLELVEI